MKQNETVAQVCKAKIEKISQMIGMLNAGLSGYSKIASYSSYPNQKIIGIETFDIPSKKKEIYFDSVHIGYSSIGITFNNLSITITNDGEFYDKDSIKHAKNIFGEKVNPNVVLYYCEEALASFLKEYADQINEFLLKRNIRHLA